MRPQRRSRAPHPDTDALDHHVLRDLRVGATQRTMDDILVFDDDRATLDAVREDVGAWLAEHRHLALKDPAARPQSTHAPLIALGHRVTRQEIRLGKKARDRLPGHLRRVAHDPERAGQVVGSFAAAFMFGAAERE